MDEFWTWMSGCVTMILLFGILVGGVTHCTISSQVESTKRVEVACAGSDLNTNAAKSAACVLALQNARSQNGN